MSELGKYTQLRAVALMAAATRQSHTTRYGAPGQLIQEAETYLAEWLTEPGVKVSRAPLMILVADQGHEPPRYRPIRRTKDMTAVMTDSQTAQYPARTATDRKGFPVDQPVVLTTDDDGAQQYADRTDNEDGSTTFAGKAPGTITLTWTCGDDTVSDMLNITTGDAVSFSDESPTITDQS